MRTALLSSLALLTGCFGPKPFDTGDAAPVDADGDGWPAGEDCDDDDATVHPGAVEVCNGVDEDCNDEIDDGVLLELHPDDDGDGFGAADAIVLACEPGPGALEDDSDCDDGDAGVNPDAAERCNGVDDDCDAAVDEDVTGTWYADADGDGHGDAGSPLEDCDPPDGYVTSDDDCDDAEPAANPSAEETCDGIDNDCDGDADEGVTTTYYLDADSDGHGVPDSTVEDCAEPSGYAATPDDCDDGDARVNPSQAESCNGVDDDCDGDLDEADAVDASRWYADGDSDGYGDSATYTVACDAPSGHVADDTDCDDGATAVNPGATELCNGIDDDCDGDIDDDDSDVADPATWYADTDGDGYGDPAATAVACVQPSAYLADDTDCDDGDGDINPAASEVCDEVDNDCDGDIDDDDSSLDTSTGGTWYADDDGDGYGDPDDSLQTCDQPSGYVSDDTDCDDTDATDTDGDGTQDCADDDIDGDGLRNEWDADPYDDSVTRAPTGGLGTDGDLVVSGSMTLSEWTLLDGGASAGDQTIDVDDGSVFQQGDELLILTQQGTGAGTWQTSFVTAVSTNSLDIEPPLEDDYGSGSTVLVQRVPHYEDVDVPSGSTLTADDWGGSGGGVLFFRASGDVSIAGTVSVDALGFRGGDGVRGNSANPYQGESVGGVGSRGVTGANDGGGGSYPRRGDNGDSGGGGGHGGAGSSGTNSGGSAVTSGGSVQGSADLGTLVFGSGGGGGSPDTEGDGSDTRNVTGDGGDGGGIVAMFCAGSITVTGTITADGERGGDATSLAGEVGGGGGGAGGAIWLASPTLTLSGSVAATGGGRGSSAWHSGRPYGSAYGGTGGVGRVRLDYTTLSGSTSPTAGHTEAWVD
jgi:hypothetical protein